MFLLRLGELLEEWTHKKSVADLASAMSLRVDSVWLQANGTEVLTKITDVKPGDRIVIRTGGMIALDGRVVEGEAMVNQSSLTGESMPVAKPPEVPSMPGRWRRRASASSPWRNPPAVGGMTGWFT